ncbi:putative E3 ubiquitin-protein ligase HIP1 [Zea mays]|uniref:RING-type E3 ubiquitin transferase n=4 Tax=Zea mays TaxID=4577 RepID=A0A1D6G2P2_MAIZE|nr:Protein binding protein [Zea mays]AQK97635.1 Protein binding protein [Zea mays]PWZ11308.1 putative E3 ubiquitin-protein ligase HIP1 [Zea mays]
MSGDRSSTAERRRGIRRLLLHPRGEASSPPPPPPAPAPEEGRRKGFASAALRGLGCTSAAASKAYAPGAAAAAALRSSADWHGRRRRRGKDRRKERGGGGAGAGGGLVTGGIGADVWCAPGIPFAAEASSVDCVVARHQTVGRGGRGAEGERSHRERPCMSRRATVQEQISSPFMDSPPPHLDAPFFGADLIPSGRLRRMRGYRYSPGGLEEEIMMFQTRVLLGGMNMYDRYQDWRLDVDNMTYEELVELGDRIGYVNTGLREDEIARSLRKAKHPSFGSLRFAAEVERKCTICQEEFQSNEEMGRLVCGHSYHVLCIKQWLSQKNTCPVCKTAVSKN